MIDKKLIERIESAWDGYEKYSVEENLASQVRGWVSAASRANENDSVKYLQMADNDLKRYSEQKGHNERVLTLLKDVMKDSRKLYSKMELITAN